MACIHKFHHYLNLERVDFEPTTLMVGTFNPSWPIGNQAEWFYGRTGNNYFWDVLPRLCDPNLNLRYANPLYWKAFCREHRIAITDMIYSIDDADPYNPQHVTALRGYQDSAISREFHQFTFTDIVALLQAHPSIERIYFTRQPGVPLFDNQWQLICNYAQQVGKVATNLITPSASARFQMGGYMLANPHDGTPLRNFIFQEWSNVW